MLFRSRMSVFYFSRSTQRWRLLAKDIRPEIGTCTANTALTDCRITSLPRGSIARRRDAATAPAQESGPIGRPSMRGIDEKRARTAVRAYER